MISCFDLRQELNAPLSLHEMDDARVEYLKKVSKPGKEFSNILLQLVS